MALEQLQHKHGDTRDFAGGTKKLPLEGREGKRREEKWKEMTKRK
jgi:hypothetical protein